MEPLKTFGASDKKSLEVEETISSEESLIKVYPNPSNGNFIVQGFLPENIETGIMNFRDLSGRIVKSVSLSGNNIRKVIFLENANGVYLYEVVCKTKIVARGKVIIQN